MSHYQPPSGSAFTLAAAPDGRAMEQAALRDAIDTLRRRGDAVAEIACALDLSAERMARAEALDRLELEMHLPLAGAVSLDQRQVRRWFEVLDDDLALDFAFADGDAEKSLALRAASASAEALRVFLDDVQMAAEAQGYPAQVQVRLAIAKTRAVAAATALLAERPDYLGTPEMRARTKVVVYYHADALRGLLRLSAAPDWERLGLARADGRVVFVLCDAAGYLAGPAVEMLGAHLGEEPRWLILSRAAWRQFQTHTAETRQLRDDEGNWPGADRVLTPAHLRVTSRDAGLERVAGWLAGMHAELAAAYLASSVHAAPDNQLMLRFAGTRPCACALPAVPPAPHTEASASDALARLATWAYDHASPDKLAIVRECLARELPPGGAVSLADLECVAPGTLESAKANFALYLRARTAEYFQLREKAEDAVADYSRTVRKTVTDLTGEVVGNVFGTVGLLAGAVIAGLIQPSTSLAVQRLATILYTAYVVFLLLYLMRARWQRYRLESDDVSRRLRDMPELSETQRSHLQRQASHANRHFEEYYRLSRLIYLVLAALGLLYFLLLLTPLAPHISLPHPAVTPTPRGS